MSVDRILRIESHSENAVILLSPNFIGDVELQDRQHGVCLEVEDLDRPMLLRDEMRLVSSGGAQT